MNCSVNPNDRHPNDRRGQSRVRHQSKAVQAERRRCVELLVRLTREQAVWITGGGMYVPVAALLACRMRMEAGE